jgi:hypothetical protein
MANRYLLEKEDYGAPREQLPPVILVLDLAGEHAVLEGRLEEPVRKGRGDED